MHLSDDLKWLIIHSHFDFGLDIDEIRALPRLKRVDGSKPEKKTILYWLRKYLKTNKTLKTGVKLGRPNVLSEEKKSSLKDSMIQNPKKPLSFHKEVVDTFACIKTISNEAKKIGFRCGKAPNKPLLKEHHVKDRLDFVNRWTEIGSDEYKKIVFIDEKLYNFRPCNNKVNVWYLPGHLYDEENCNFTEPNVASKNVNTISWISQFGKGNIYLAENCEFFDEDGKRIQSGYKGFNNTSFMKVLKEKILKDIKEQVGNCQIYIGIDNAPIHNKKENGKILLDEFLAEENIERIPWPARSPDLNPIEHVHSLVQNIFYKRCFYYKEMIKNKKDSFKALLESWNDLENQNVINCFNKFKKKIETVKNLNGKNNYNG